MERIVKTVPTPAMYNHDYFECGPAAGVSSYMNYSWMPELTIRMAHFIISRLPIRPDETVLDYGCAKGFLVKALRLLGIDAYGVDVSAYAIAHSDAEVRDYCALVGGCDDPDIFIRPYDWMIAKDVFEHIPEEGLRQLLTGGVGRVRRIFAAIPLAADDHSGKYIIPEYDRDVTHVVAKTGEWWQGLFEDCGWKVEAFSNTFEGCKENWTSRWAHGNGFIVAQSKAW